MAPLVAHFFNSSMVMPKYSKLRRLAVSSSPAGVIVAIKPGMLSTINTSLLISLGKAAHLEPSVRAVSPSHAMLYVLRLPGFDGTAQLFDELREVVRIDQICN